MARVFGVMETLLIASVALGSLLAPLLIEADRGARGLRRLSVGCCRCWQSRAWGGSWRALSAAAPAPTRRLEMLEAIPLFGTARPRWRWRRLAARLEEMRVGGVGEGDRPPGRGRGSASTLSPEGEVEVAGRWTHGGGPKVLARTSARSRCFGTSPAPRPLPPAPGRQFFALGRAGLHRRGDRQHPLAAPPPRQCIGTRLGRARPAGPARSAAAVAPAPCCGRVANFGFLPLLGMGTCGLALACPHAGGPSRRPGGSPSARQRRRARGPLPRRRRGRLVRARRALLALHLAIATRASASRRPTPRTFSRRPSPAPTRASTSCATTPRSGPGWPS